MAGNQIQLYRDLTCFWLDRDWRTPREKQLEREVARLRQENKALKQRLEPLLVFEDIPCCYCGKPLSDWTREEVLKAFKSWHHFRCER